MSNTAELKTTKNRAYRGQNLELRQAERREKLLNAGLNVIGEVGFRAMTIRAVCAEAGLTERYFYEAFRNNTDFFQAVYQAQIDTLRANIQNKFAENQLSIQENTPNNRQTDQVMVSTQVLAELGLSAYFETLQNPKIARIILCEILGVNATIDQHYRQVMEEFSIFIQSISQNQSQVVENPISQAELSFISMGMVGAGVHIGTRWFLGNYAEDISVVLRSALRIFNALGETLRANAAIMRG